MKLRNILLSVSALGLCSVALADNSVMNTGAMAKGGTYVGLAGGWGKIENDSRSSDLFAADANTQTGGFAGRVYFGYLTPLNSNLLFGPEIGYSTYTNNTYHAHNTDDDVDVHTKESGYGIDILANITYMFNNALNLSIKPGFQYAFQKVSNDDTYFEFFNIDQSAQDSKILPEINLEANWQVSANTPLFLGASYQYVFGSDARGNLVNVAYRGYTQVSSRQMIAVNLEYMFS